VRGGHDRSSPGTKSQHYRSRSKVTVQPRSKIVFFSSLKKTFATSTALYYMTAVSCKPKLVFFRPCIKEKNTDADTEFHYYQETQLSQRDRATRYVSKFVLSITRYGS